MKTFKEYLKSLDHKSFENTLYNVLKSYKYVQTLTTNQSIHTISRKYFYSDYNREVILDAFKKNGFKLFADSDFRRESSVEEDESGSSRTSFLFVNEDDGDYFVVDILDGKENVTINLELNTNDISRFDALDKIILDNVSTKEPSKVNFLTQNSGGWSTVPIESEKVKFEKENYSDKVNEKIDLVFKKFNKKNSSGNLLILNGPPGTGKTHLIRHFTADFKNAYFLFIPPELVPEIGRPGMIGFINNLCKKNMDRGKNTYLVLEDADTVLLSRGTDNMTLVHSLLNLTDGVLGKSLGIKVIATTNAKTLNMDKAIMRAGRLFDLIQVEELDPAQCNKVYRRLGGTGEDFTKKYVLADIYKAVSDEMKEEVSEDE